MLVPPDAMAGIANGGGIHERASGKARNRHTRLRCARSFLNARFFMLALGMGWRPTDTDRGRAPAQRKEGSRGCYFVNNFSTSRDEKGVFLPACWTLQPGL